MSDTQRRLPTVDALKRLREIAAMESDATIVGGTIRREEARDVLLLIDVLIEAARAVVAKVEPGEFYLGYLDIEQEFEDLRAIVGRG